MYESKLYDPSTYIISQLCIQHQPLFQEETKLPHKCDSLCTIFNCRSFFETKRLSGEGLLIALTEVRRKEGKKERRKEGKKERKLK